MGKVRNVLKLGFDEKGHVMVYGPLDDKKMCMFVLTEAIKIVSENEPPKIITPRIEILKPNG